MTDKQYSTLLKTMADVGETLGARLDRHDVRFDSIDQRLDRIEQRLDEHDARFNAIDQRFDAIDARLNSMDVRFKTIGARFDAMDARFKAVDKNFTEIYKILVDFTQTSSNSTNETRAVQKKHDTRLSALEKRLMAKLA